MRVVAGAVVAWPLLSGLLHGMMYWAGVASTATLVFTVFIGFCPACAMIGRRYLDQ